MAYELIRLVHFAALFVVSATVLIHYIAFAPEITRRHGFLGGERRGADCRLSTVVRRWQTCQLL